MMSDMVITTEGHTDPEAIKRSRQDRKVCYIRGTLIVVLVIVTIAVATFAGVYVTYDEHNNFLTQYADSFEIVQITFQTRLDVKRDCAMTLSAMFTSQYGPLGAFPNVTTTNFEEQVKGLLLISNSRALSFNPIITQDVNRLQWEAHAAENAYLLGDPLPIYGNETWPDNRTIDFGIYSRDANKTVIYDPGYDPDSVEYSNIMVPVWQIAPYAGNERAVMFNLHSEINRMNALDNMMKYGVTSLTAILQLVQDKDDIRPSAILFYPVFDSFDKNTSKVPVGSISLVFSWDTFLADVLPDYIRGLVGVLSASTGQTFTYIIRGNDVEFMGEGDLHDPKYNEYQEMVEARLLIEGDEKAGEFILYTLTLYPSEEFESQYTTKKPIIYAVGAMCIFIFTALIFFLYDKLVEDRQEKTSRLARQSGSIVESMFPAGFRDRLYKIQSPDEQRHRRSSGGSACAEELNTESNSINLSSINHTSLHPVRRSSSVVNSATSKATMKRINMFMKTNLFGDNGSDQEQGVLEGEAIAELFHDTSIMFSDIVGFTKWSSEHTPNEVFKLLEQIFWEFDEVAARLNIFKLGTIGDCYIAVTGIPEAVQNHATLLTEFAFEARDKVREVFARLESEGLDTYRLDMRFGIHSGDTTAGILRGAKPRFELFGDTINTASRMESMGLPGKIQLSADTAGLINRDGKSHWLTKRDTTITAKGKGEMQTYWAEPARRVSFTDTQVRNSLVRSSEGSSFFDSTAEGTAEEESPEEPSKGALESEAVDGTENEFNRDFDSIQIDLDPDGYDPVFLKLISRESSANGRNV